MNARGLKVENNKGYKIEKAMMQWFKGKSHLKYCVDFQTKNALYEVKSCRLFNECVNGNHKRKYTEKKHKKITTTQMGRFPIGRISHENLLGTSKLEKKIPKYIFVLLIGKQKVWVIKSWEEVDCLMNKKRITTAVRIKDIFIKQWRHD